MSGLEPGTKYYVRAYATTSSRTLYGEQKEFTTKDNNGGDDDEPTTGTINGHEWVDLGLPSGLKWATCNVGADSPEDYGDYYAWGETTTKSIYTEENSITYDVVMSDISGNSQYDVARKKWSSTWRMPTKAELVELKNECTWTWTTQGGKEGYKVIGPNGSCIFLPAAGFRSGSSLYYAGYNGYYWSSTPYDDDYNDILAYYLDFGNGIEYVGIYNRSSGQTVRPVSN